MIVATYGTLQTRR